MKWIFMLLLVTNIAVLLWGWLQGITPTSQKPVVEAGMGNLRLLSRPGEPMPQMIPPPFRDEAGLTEGPESAPSQTTDAAPMEDMVESAAVEVLPVETTSAEAPTTEEPDGKVEEVAEQEVSFASEVEQADAASEQLQPPGLLQQTTAGKAESARLEMVPEVPGEVPEKPEPMLPETCGSIGPIEDGEVAGSIVTELEQLDIQASLEQQSHQKPTGYWVIIPPFPTRQQAIDTVNSLKQKGVEDTGRFFKGEFRNGVSLGIFSRRRNAEKRRDQIAAKGFTPRVIPRIRDVIVYRVDYRASGLETKQALQAFISRYPKLEHQEQGCDDGRTDDLKEEAGQP